MDLCQTFGIYVRSDDKLIITCIVNLTQDCENSCLLWQCIPERPLCPRLLSPSSASTCGQVVIPTHLSADRGLVGRYLTRWEFSLFSGRPIGGHLRFSIFHFPFPILYSAFGFSVLGFWQLSTTNIHSFYPTIHLLERHHPPHAQCEWRGKVVWRAWQGGRVVAEGGEGVGVGVEANVLNCHEICIVPACLCLCLRLLHNAQKWRIEIGVAA